MFQVKLAYQESEVAALLKKIPRGPSEMSTIRCRAEELREGTLCDYRPVLPLMLASFIFDVLCAPGMPHSNWRSGGGGYRVGVLFCFALRKLKVLRLWQSSLGPTHQQLPG